MAWKPSAIYRVSHCDGWVIPEQRIYDFIYDAARDGDEKSRKRITMAYRDLVKHAHKRDPGRIEYRDLIFKRLKNVPRPPTATVGSARR